jgi:tetratricopeptide (TPR) repeat protein
MMDVSGEHMELIEKYFDDEMNQQELDEFRSRLESDPELRAAFNEMELLLDGVLYSASQTTLEEKLQRIAGLTVENEAEHILSSGKPEIKTVLLNAFRTYSMAIAASLSLVMVASITWLVLFRSVPADKLADRYFRLPEFSGVGITRGNEVPGQGMDYRVFLAIENQEYAKAAAWLDEAAGVNNSEEIILWAGIAHYLNHNYGKAQWYYKMTIERHGGYESEGSWYLGLCYLKQNKREEAKALLSKIVLSGTSRTEEARSLLGKLK